jgi:hypothetical protein
MDTEKYPSGAQRSPRKGKGRYDLIPAEALTILAEVLEKGAAAYGEGNWEMGIPMDRCMDSALRHLNEVKLGLNEEDHLGHALANLVFMVALRERISRGLLPRSLDPKNYCHLPDLPLPIRVSDYNGIILIYPSNGIQVVSKEGEVIK